MGSKTRVQELDEARNRVRELEEEEAGGSGGAVHVHVHTSDKSGEHAHGTGTGEDDKNKRAPTMDKAVEERFVKIEKGMEETGKTLGEILAAVKSKTGDGKLAAGAAGAGGEGEDGAGEGTPSQRAQTGDSKALETSFTEFTSQAEILVPGFRVPTFDAASPRKTTVDSMCMGRRGVLTAAVATTEGKSLLDSVSPGFDVSKAGCADVAVVFKAAAATKAAMNNRQATGDSGRVPAAGAGAGAKVVAMPSLESINEANRKFWAGQERA